MIAAGVLISLCGPVLGGMLPFMTLRGLPEVLAESLVSANPFRAMMLFGPTISTLLSVAVTFALPVSLVLRVSDA